MRHLTASSCLVVSAALGASLLSAQSSAPGVLTLRASRDVTLLTGPHLLSPPRATSPMPNQEWTILNPQPTPGLKLQPLTLTPLSPSAYSLSGAAAPSASTDTVSPVAPTAQAEFEATKDKRARAEARLEKLRAEREAALRRKAELDAMIEQAERAPAPTPR